MSLLDHRRIIGASDLNGYAITVVTEGKVGGNVVFVFVDEAAGLGPSFDRLNSVISERKVSTSDIIGGLRHRYGTGKPPVRAVVVCQPTNPPA